MSKVMNWLLNGNKGTTPPTDFCGTTDNQPLVIKTNNAERIRVDVAGNVGIGHPAPDRNLTVYLGGPSTGVYSNVKNDAHEILVGVDGTAIVSAMTNSDLQLRTNNATRMVIKAGTGNVGIGSTTPSTPLHVVGRITTGSDFSSAGAITFRPPDGFAYFHIDNGGSGRPNGRLRVSVGVNPGDVELISILQDGNIGIGTASPKDKLHLSSQGAVRCRINSDNSSGIALTLKEQPQWSVAIIPGPPVPTRGPSPNPADFQINNDLVGQNVLCIAGASLCVGIGTTSPAAKLHVSGKDVVRSRINSDSNAGVALTLNEQPQWSVATVPSAITTVKKSGLSGSAQGDFQIYNDRVGENALYIDGTSLNVGIGTSSPGAKLEVNGDVKVSGNILLPHADCAEDFDIVEADTIEPGTVMVIDQEGALRQSRQAYDKRVAGVISGAGDYKPGIVLDKHQSQDDNRMPIALVGKVYCKVDAQYRAIEVGDLLTTSPTPGHAMTTEDPLKAFGAVIGKALRPLKAGQGLIPILIALQ